MICRQIGIEQRLGRLVVRKRQLRAQQLIAIQETIAACLSMGKYGLNFTPVFVSTLKAPNVQFIGRQVEQGITLRLPIVVDVGLAATLQGEAIPMQSPLYVAQLAI